MPNGLALAVVLLIIMLFLAYILSMLLNFLTPYYTTPNSFLKEFLKRVKLNRDSRFVDLGCGDGRVVFGVYDTFKCNSTGYEISPMLLIFLKLKRFFKYPFNSKVNILEESFFKVDLSKYDTVYCCLPSDILEILQPKFEHELKRGTLLYSYQNKVGSLEGEALNIDNHKVYLYTF